MVSFKIAMRFLTSSKFQTILIILGFAIGISVQVFVGTLLTSLQVTLLERTIGNSPHITVFPSEEGVNIENWEVLIEEISEIEEVEHVSAAIDGNALVNTPGNKTFPGLVRGFKLKAADRIYDIFDRIYEGRAPESANQVLLGRENQEEFQLKINDDLELVLPNGTKKTMKISGFFDFEVATLNQRWVITSLTGAQGLFGFSNEVTSIEMQVVEVFEADSVAKDVEKKIDDDELKVTNWKDENEQLLSALQAQGSSSLMIQLFVVVSVVIAIASVLSISVVQKSRQIGILKAMGITDGKASLIFVIQGLVLGIAGGIVGVFLGLGLFLGFVYGAGVVEPYIDWVFVIGSAMIAIFATTFAALIPARKSSKLNPIEVIRNG
jgi:lipoprotein-releasing system permease protein